LVNKRGPGPERFNLDKLGGKKERYLKFEWKEGHKGTGEKSGGPTAICNLYRHGERNKRKSRRGK